MVTVIVTLIRNDMNNSNTSSIVTGIGIVTSKATPNSKTSNIVTVIVLVTRNEINTSNTSHIVTVILLVLCSL